MKKVRFFALSLALMMALTVFPTAALAIEENSWLLPKMRDYAAFTDTAGTICEDAARTCCEAGLMDGVDGSHFLPDSGLSHAQIIVISARLHRLLTGETLAYFEPISLTGADWWIPYDGYLREQVPALAEDLVYLSMREFPTSPCYREEFLYLLAAVLAETGTTLPELNQVQAVPDCDNQAFIQFYRWGVLSGKDAYGTLYGDAALSRAAAAALLARLIDPAQRMTLELKPLELCRELLDTDPETVLMTVAGKEITAGEFMPTLVSTVSYFNNSHFAAMALEMNGRTEVDEAVSSLCRQVSWETLAQEHHIAPLSMDPADYHAGYRGLTVSGQMWEDTHAYLLTALSLYGVPEEELAASGRVPQPEFSEAWSALDFSEISRKVAALPYWGGYF